MAASVSLLTQLIRPCVRVQAIKFVEDTSTLYPATLFYASAFAGSVSPIVSGLQTNAGGQVVDALRGALDDPSGGTRAELALEDLYEVMAPTCADAGVTCVGVFVSDSGGVTDLTLSIDLARDFKSDVGSLAYFFIGENSEVRTASAPLHPSAGRCVSEQRCAALARPSC